MLGDLSLRKLPKKYSQVLIPTQRLLYFLFIIVRVLFFNISWKLRGSHLRCFSPDMGINNFSSVDICKHVSALNPALEVFSSVGCHVRAVAMASKTRLHTNTLSSLCRFTSSFTKREYF